jgi:hypothetical protein
MTAWPSAQGLDNYGKNHCFINSAVQAIFHLATPEDITQELTYLRRSPGHPVYRELLSVLESMHSRRHSSVDRLRDELQTSFMSSGHFRTREFGDSYEAFNAILQLLCKANPDSRLVKRFQLIITEASRCSCSSTELAWSPDTFGISLEVTSRPFLAELRQIFEGKEVRMCLKDKGRCQSTLMICRLTVVPSVMVVQLNYNSRSAYHTDVRGGPIPEAFSLRDLMPESSSREEYQLKGAVLMTPGHFFSGFRTSPHSWKVFNDSNVSNVSVSSFNEFQSSMGYYAKPYLLFFERRTSDYHPPHQTLTSQTPPQVLTSSLRPRYEADATIFFSSAVQIIAALGADKIRTDYANYASNKLLAVLKQTASDLTQPRIRSISDLFQSPPACSDVCDSYNAILQELSRAQPKLSVVRSFRISQCTEYHCCRRGTEKWSEDCFSISVSELEHLNSAFKSKPCEICRAREGTTQKLLNKPDILTIHKDNSTLTPHTSIQERLELYDITGLNEDKLISYVLAGAVFASHTLISTGFQKDGAWVKYANLGMVGKGMSFDRFCSTFSSEHQLIFLFYQRTHGHTAPLMASQHDLSLLRSDNPSDLTPTRGIHETRPGKLRQSRVEDGGLISSDMHSGLAESRARPVLTKAQHVVLELALHGVATLFECTIPATMVEQILVEMKRNTARETVQSQIQELNFTPNSLRDALKFVMNQLPIKATLELQASISCKCSPPSIDQSRSRSFNIVQVKPAGYSLEESLTNLYARSDCRCKLYGCRNATLTYKPTGCPNVLIFELEYLRALHEGFMQEEFNLSNVFAISRGSSKFSLQAVVSSSCQSFYKHQGTWKNRFTQESTSLRGIARGLSNCSAFLFYKKMSA